MVRSRSFGGVPSEQQAIIFDRKECGSGYYLVG